MDYVKFPHYWVNHLSFQLRKQLEVAFTTRGYQVTSEEWAILLILNKHQQMTPVALSRLTLRDPTTVSRLIDRLESKALVERSRTRRDRRIVDIQMTDAGATMFGDLAKIAQQIVQQSLAGLTASDIETSIHVLRKISENLAEIGETADV